MDRSLSKYARLILMLLIKEACLILKMRGAVCVKANQEKL